MRTTHAPNKVDVLSSLPRVSSERALECAGRCGLVSQLGRKEAERAARFVCSTCHRDGRAPDAE